jgi:hypothetical protein
MAKWHNNFRDTVDEVSGAKKRVTIYTEKTKKLTGRTIQEEKCFILVQLVTWTRTRHSVERGCNSSHKQLWYTIPLSKSYISHPLYNELEQKKLNYVWYTSIITKNSTLGHLAVSRH